MGLYDAFKDALNVAQKADNVELYRQLLDLSAQALSLQAENERLRLENQELRRQKVTEELIVRHTQPYITLSGDSTIKYCAVCWDSDNKLIQMTEFIDSGVSKLRCIKCKNRCYL